MDKRCKFIRVNGSRCKLNSKKGEYCHHHISEACPICFELVKTDLKELTCEHVFHTECITQWFVSADTCPVCRVAQGKDSYIKFKMLVEENMRQKYKDAIDSFEEEIYRLRRENRILSRRPIAGE